MKCVFPKLLNDLGSCCEKKRADTISPLFGSILCQIWIGGAALFGSMLCQIWIGGAALFGSMLCQIWIGGAALFGSILCQNWIGGAALFGSILYQNWQCLYKGALYLFFFYFKI